MTTSKRRKTGKGELNKLIDVALHPYFNEYPAMIFLDGLLHAMVENDPDVSVRKFIRYNVPRLVKLITRKSG
jgi:hypothetical protein